MTVSIPPGFAEAIVPITNAASPHVASVTFGIDLSAVTAGAATAANLVMGAWNTGISALMDSETVAGPTTLVVGQDGGPPLTVIGTDTFNGLESTASLPANCAVLCKKTSATGGRRGRGRFFLPWAVGEAFVDEGGIISSARVTAINAGLDTFLTSLASTDVPMVLLHSPGISTAGPPSVVTGLTADRLIGTQRRRLGR